MADFSFTTAGESHGPGLVAIVEGLPAGWSSTASGSTARWRVANSVTAAAGG